MNISKNAVVSIDYELTDDDGKVIDKSDAGDPLTYLHGAQNIIPGLEEALEGKSKGDKVEVSISPEKGYGVRREEMVQIVPKQEFQNADELAEGMQFELDTEDGTWVLTVVEIRENDIVLDGNHPLAGINLNFSVVISDVRDATEEELEHGHANGPGGHQH